MAVSGRSRYGAVSAISTWMASYLSNRRQSLIGFGLYGLIKVLGINYFTLSLSVEQFA